MICGLIVRCQQDISVAVLQQESAILETPTLSQIGEIYSNSSKDLPLFSLLQLRLSVTFVEFNSLRPRQNGRQFADDPLKHFFWNGNVSILIKISLKLVPKCPFNNILALDQIMAWSRPGNKPLSEPMIVRLPTHTCITRPQWVNIWAGITKMFTHLFWIC